MNDSPLSPLVRLAERDDHFVASRLAQFKRHRGVDDAGLAEFLGCEAEQLPRLALCVAPQEQDHFPTQVGKIAAFADCDANRLASLFRECDAVRIVSRQVAQDQPNYSLAARDNKQKREPESNDDHGGEQS